jgi:hypothetical protein
MKNSTVAMGGALAAMVAAGWIAWPLERPPVATAFSNGVERLVTAANSPSSWPEKNIDAEAQALFKIGDHVSQYTEPMKQLGFSFYENQGTPTNQVVLFTKKTLKPQALGSAELRIILNVDSRGLIEAVRGRVFLHTL